MQLFKVSILGVESNGTQLLGGNKKGHKYITLYNKAAVDNSFCKYEHSMVNGFMLKELSKNLNIKEKKYSWGRLRSVS